jgi:hypothetical protein
MYGRLSVELLIEMSSVRGYRFVIMAVVDEVLLHRLWAESSRVVEQLSRLVAQGKSVDAASLFGRWLVFSGVLEMCEENPQSGLLEVHGRELRVAVKELVSECGDLYRTGKANPRYAETDIAEINRKLDFVMARLGDGSLSGPLLGDDSTTRQLTIGGYPRQLPDSNGG